MGTLRQWLISSQPAAQHRSYPIFDDASRLVGIITRREPVGTDASATSTVADAMAKPLPTTCLEDTLRAAVDVMARSELGRLSVVARGEPIRLVGILTSTDLLRAQGRRLQDNQQRKAAVPFRRNA